MPRVRSATIAALTAATLASLAPRTATANGRLPGANQLVFSFDPSTSNVAVLRTTFGMLITHDDGATWDWVCEAAIGGLQNGIDPAIGLTASGAVVATVSPGLDVSSNTGCNWAASACPFPSLYVIDVAVRPDTPHAIVAVASTPNALLGSGSVCAGSSAEAGAPLDAGSPDEAGTPPDAGAGLYQNRIFESKDDGAHWAVLGGALDASIVITTIDVTATDPHRIYASGFREIDDGDGGTKREASLFVSNDDGASWAEHAIPLEAPNETSVFIAAIDKTDADRVYLRTAGPGKVPSRLIVTADAGGTFTSPLAFTGPMLGFALSSDGADVYAGSMEDGLFAASRASLTFAKKSSIPITCLAVHGADLWACSDDKSGFLAGVSNDKGTTFAPKLHFCSIHGALSCAAGDTAAQCSGAAFDFLDKGLGCQSIGPTDDAGPSALDASTGSPDASVAIPAPPKSSCGCVTAGGNGRADCAGFLASAAFLLVLGARRRNVRATRARGVWSRPSCDADGRCDPRDPMSARFESCRPISELPYRARATNSLAQGFGCERRR